MTSQHVNPTLRVGKNKKRSYLIIGSVYAGLSEHLHSMQEVLGSNPQIDTMDIHPTKCVRMEFSRFILQYEYLASNEVQKTVLKLKHMINIVSQYRLTKLGVYISANLTKVSHY